MIRIHIGNPDTFPEQILQLLENKFKINKNIGVFPILYFIDRNTGKKHEVAKVASFGVTEDGYPGIDLDLSISMQLNEENGEILSVTMEESRDGNENKRI